MAQTTVSAATASRPIPRSYRVLNVDAGRPAGAPLSVPATPVAMVNRDRRWCLTLEEAKELAVFARAHGYAVEIVQSAEGR
jgi:hypothetical protein